MEANLLSDRLISAESPKYIRSAEIEVRRDPPKPLRYLDVENKEARLED